MFKIIQRRSDVTYIRELGNALLQLFVLVEDLVRTGYRRCLIPLSSCQSTMMLQPHWRLAHPPSLMILARQLPAQFFHQGTTLTKNTNTKSKIPRKDQETRNDWVSRNSRLRNDFQLATLVDANILSCCI